MAREKESHEPERTARTKRSPVLLLPSLTMPVLRLASHALLGVAALLEDDQ